MRWKSRMAAYVCGAALLALPAVGLAGAEQEKAAIPPEMEEYIKLSQPGEHHAHMAKMVGTWKAHVKSWTAPGAPPEESDGTMVVKAVLDGRFFQSEFEGAFAGIPFHGLALDGYDNAKKKHIGVWADSMGTMFMVSEGTCSQGGKVVETKGTYDDPVTKKASYMRSVYTTKDDGTVVMESFGPDPEGKEVKMMEITFTRR